MKSIFLAWQAPENTSESKAWYPIGRLDAISNEGLESYRFRYTHGAERAQREVGFNPLVSFPKLAKDYTSEKLFALFHNRIISSKREDFADYIDWLGLTKEQADPLSILSVSEGLRVTDNLQTVPKVEQSEDGSFRLRFFSHGLRHLNEASRNRAKNLKAGDELRVLIEANNPATTLAIPLLDEDYVMVGWAPRYLVHDLLKSIPNAPEIKATVVKVNKGYAPINQSLLIEYSGKAPLGHKVMSGLDFTPLIPD